MWVCDAGWSAGGGASKSRPGQNTYQSSSEATHPSVPAGQPCQATELHCDLEEVGQLISSEYLRYICNYYEIALLERDLILEQIVSFRFDSPALVVFPYILNHHFGTIAILDPRFSLVAIQSYQLTKSILYELFITGLFMHMAKCSLSFQVSFIDPM